MLFEPQAPTGPSPYDHPTNATLDGLLSLQLAVAWAGEGGAEPRLGWWRTDLVSEYGGHDLFKRLLPATWEWAALDGARAAAITVDEASRTKVADAQHVVTLFHFGFKLDERLDQRLFELKTAGAAPSEALPALAVMGGGWNRAAFETWLASHGPVETAASPTGRLVKSADPSSPLPLARHLTAALLPLGREYPMPYTRRIA